MGLDMKEFEEERKTKSHERLLRRNVIIIQIGGRTQPGGVPQRLRLHVQAEGFILAKMHFTKCLFRFRYQI